jgi:putative alpha-1,2-mannosidase
MLEADKGGNAFVGPTLLFGMGMPGPDYGDSAGNSGWKAIGISQLYISGTGGAP